MKTYGVIMAGGGGTRFWPLSRKEKPKQFLNLSGKDSMVTDTVKRLCKIANPEDIFVVTNKDYVEATLKETGELLRKDHILGEPAARNTAACIGYAAMEIIKKYGDGIMCIMPSDHFIKNEEQFVKVMKHAVSVATAEDVLVTIGIKPTFPSTGYGYIRCNKETEQDVYPVMEFVEKPDYDRAVAYMESGAYAWNSGMFVWKASLILQYFEELLPDIHAHLQTIADAMNTEREAQVIAEVYPVIPKISIDYGIMERASKVCMIEGDFGWNDVGSYDALAEIYSPDKQGNISLGNSKAIDATGCIFYNDKEKLIAAMGVEDLIIAQTDDIVLVCKKELSQQVKQFVEELEQEGKHNFL